MKKIVALVMLFLALPALAVAGPAINMDTVRHSETSSDKSTKTDITRGTERQKSDRTVEQKGDGGRSSESTARKSSSTRQRTMQARETVDLIAVLVAELTDITLTDGPPVKGTQSCEDVLLGGITAEGLGFSAAVRPGVIDAYQADAISKYQQQRGEVRMVSARADKQLSTCAVCLSVYAAVLADAARNIVSELGAYGVSLDRVPLSVTDIREVARKAILHAARKIKSSKYSRRIAAVNKMLKRYHWRFGEHLESYQAGSLALRAGSTPALQLGGIKVYDPAQMWGRGYQLSVERGGSASASLDVIRQDEKYKTWLKQCEEAVQKLEKEGKTVAASMLKHQINKSWREGKAGISPSSMLQQIFGGLGG